MLTISAWPRRLKEFLLTHPLYKSPMKCENESWVQFRELHRNQKPINSRIMRISRKCAHLATILPTDYPTKQQGVRVRALGLAVDLVEGLRAVTSRRRRNLELEGRAIRLRPVSRRRRADRADLGDRRDAVVETRPRGARLRNYFKN